MFRKKLKNFMCNLGKLFTFSFGFLGLFGLIALLGGWSLDYNDNLVSDNIYSGQKYYKYDDSGSETIEVGQMDYNINEITLTDNLYFYIKITGATLNNRYFSGFGIMVGYGSDSSNEIYFTIEIESDAAGNYPYASYGDTLDVNTEIYYFKFIMDTSDFNGQKINYIAYDIYGDYCETDDFMISYKDNLYEYQPYNELYYNEDNIGGISFNIDDYSVSVGNTPTQISYDYTKTEDVPYNFNSIGYLDISFIYNMYISNGNNNTIYISTPVNNLLSFDMQFNFNTMPNVTIKTFLSLPNGMINNFIFSSDDFNYKENWSLSNFVAVSSIANNYDLNDISYVDIMITYNNVGNTLSEVKLGNNNGYNAGFENGYNKGLEAIDFWKLQYNTLKNDYNNLSSTVDILNNRINQLNEQLENTVGWKPFIFTMADTPFRVVSNVLGFEVFGVNLYKVLIGLITTLAILWLIRKLRK